MLDRSTADLLAAALPSPIPKRFSTPSACLKWSGKCGAPVIRGLLSHPHRKFARRRSILRFRRQDGAPGHQWLTGSGAQRPHRSDALPTHHAHVDPLESKDEGDFADFSVSSAVVAYLARPGETQILEAAQQILTTMVGEASPDRQRHRVEAARLLGELPDCFDPLLSNLISDPDPVVAREAIHSVGKLRKRRLVPELLDRLAHRELRTHSASALGEFGDTIVGALRDHLGDDSVAVEARREIPFIMVKIWMLAAAQVLMENLLERDTTLRFRIISALNKLQRLHPGIETDTQTLETVLAAEILGHYRSFQILEKAGNRGRQRISRRARVDGIHAAGIGAHLSFVGPALSSS